MLVLADNNPVRHIRRPWVNWGLIALCVVVFFANPPYLAYGFTPIHLQLAVLHTDARLASAVVPQLVSYMFLHADIFHLGGNMLALWVFGNNIEDSMGHRRYPLFFVLCGVAGALLEGLFAANPAVPVVGASGAVSGVMGAYLLLHPRARVLVLVALRFPLLIPASVFVGVSVGLDVLMAVLPAEEADPLVAWWAHIGGFAAGALLILVMRHRDVPLFQPAHIYPENAFGRVRRVLLDLGHDRMAGSRPASLGARAVFAVKTVIFFLIILVVVESLVA